MLNTCSHQGGEGGNPPHSIALPAHSQGMEGETPTRQRDTPECSQGTEEGGAPPDNQRALPVHDLREREMEEG